MFRSMRARLTLGLGTGVLAASLIVLGVPTAAPAVTVPGGVPMPVGDLPHFHQVFAGKFTTPAAPGHFLSVYKNWGAYPSNYVDTCGNGHYSPQNLSVSNGMLHLNLKPGHGNAPYPVPSTGWDHRYRRYDVRFKVMAAVPGYHMAWLLWPESEVWPRDGEIDFPEADLDGTIDAFMHRQGGTSGGDQDVYTTNVRAAGAWHTATTIWTPGSLVFQLDGRVIGHSTSRVPNTPMHQVLQTEIGCSPATSPVDVRIAWAVVYDWHA